MKDVASVFKALSDQTRLKMLCLMLSEGELCVCDFVELLRISQSKASRHLRRLVVAGLADDRRDSYWVYYRVVERPGPVQSLLLAQLPGATSGRVPSDLLRRLDLRRRRKGRGRVSCERSAAKGR